MPNPHVKQINSAGITYCEPDWSWNTSRRPPTDHDLWTVFSGQGRLETSTTAYDLLPGDCFILQPRGVYIGTHDPDHPLVVIHIHFDPIGELALGFHRRLTRLSYLRETLTRSVINHLESNTESAVTFLEAALCEIESQEHLLDGAGAENERMEEIEDVCRRIYEHPNEAFRVDEMAKSFGLSSDHFTRLFKSQKGISPREYVLRARIEAAQDLLRSSNHSIGRIADILGYSDVYFFSRQFKERVGVSPSAFRKP